MIFNLDLIKDDFSEWWKKEKGENPTEAAVGSTVVGGVTSIAGAAAIGNGLHRLIHHESTYAGIGPILTITGGLAFSVIGIKSLSESIRLYKEIKSKSTAKENKE